MTQPRIILHQGSGQPGSCLEGLVRYARRIAEHPRAADFATREAITDWCWAQPVKWDLGDGPKEAGCNPVQRSQVWPARGLNCWEATAHYVGCAMRHQAPVEIHVYDASVHGQRHVFPAVRDFGVNTRLEPVVLQPPVVAAQALLLSPNQVRELGRGVDRCSAQGRRIARRAQAWYQDVLGGLHVGATLAGDAFRPGLGSTLGGAVEDLSGDFLPEWSRMQEEARKAGAPVPPPPPAAPPPPPPPQGGAPEPAAPRTRTLLLEEQLRGTLGPQQLAEMTAQAKAAEASAVKRYLLEQQLAALDKEQRAALIQYLQTQPPGQPGATTTAPGSAG